MRFSLILNLKKNRFPIEYRKVVLSYIKNALSYCNNGKYFDEFFGDAKQKDYCFTVIFPKSKFTKNEIELENNEIKILFSTSDKNKVGIKLFSAFITQKNKSFPLENSNSMILKSIKNNKHEEILSDRAIFKTANGSGLCIREHNKENNFDNYYIYSDKNFREKFKFVVANELLSAGFSEKEVTEVSINPIDCKKVVAKHYMRYIDISVGMIEIKANKYILQHFYDTGVGSRKSTGFGMLDLVTQDLQ